MSRDRFFKFAIAIVACFLVSNFRVAFADARLLIENSYQKKQSYSGGVFYRVDLNASKSFYVDRTGAKSKFIASIRWRVKKNGSVLKEGNGNADDGSFYVVLIPSDSESSRSKKGIAAASPNEKLQVIVDTDYFGEKISTSFNLWVSGEAIYWDIDDYFDASKHFSIKNSPSSYSNSSGKSRDKSSSHGSVLLVLAIILFIFLFYINRDKQISGQSSEPRSTSSSVASSADAVSSGSESIHNHKKYDIPGYDSSWPLSIKRDFLRAEFTKWNSRMHTATGSADRKKIQSLLDEIARARLDL